MTTYKDAGVDIDKANEFVEYIKNKVAEKLGKGGVIHFGGFASGVCIQGYREPVIFSSTDGVGTKLKIAQELGIHNTIGIDLVAMNVNDVLTTGADPLFFLDYIATGKLEIKVMKEVIDGIIEGCRMGEVLLVGGETAEMPDFYPEGVYDLAGFCVGICEKDKVITGKAVREGDRIIGIRSSGFHSNGFSLIRKVLKDRGISLKDYSPELGKTVGEALLTPTRIYTGLVKKLKKEVSLKALAHITGGGILENLVRVLPYGARAIIEKKSIPEEFLFKWIRDMGKIEEKEMFRTFNMGIGMVVIVEADEAERALSILGEDGKLIGYIEKGRKEVVII